MQKKTKYLIAAGVLVAAGIGLSIVLGKGKRFEDVGELPNPDASGNTPPSDGTASQSAESQQVGGSNEIVVGDYVKPYNEYVNVRTSMEINNGWWWNNLYIASRLEGTVYSPDIVGQVVQINEVDNKTWYEINVSAAVFGENESMSTINMYNAQDTSTDALTGYVRATTCDEVDAEGVCIGVAVPTLKKV